MNPFPPDAWLTDADKAPLAEAVRVAASHPQPKRGDPDVCERCGGQVCEMCDPRYDYVPEHQRRVRR